MLLLFTLFGCDVGFDAVAISPIYGWEDGCTAVAITGHGFGADVAAKVGENAVTDVTLPTDALTKGFRLDGIVPAGTPGLHDVTVTSGGETSVITGTGGYYYVACPARGWIDVVAAQGAAGDTVEITGCSLDTGLKMQLVDSTGTAVGDPAALTSACGTARVTFPVPAVADGSYYLTLVDDAGELVTGAICLPPDTADTGYSCTDYPFTVGAAR